MPSTLYDDVYVTRLKAHGIIPMDVTMQEEYLNLHAKYLADSAIQVVLTDVQNEDELQCIDLLAWQHNAMQMKLQSQTW